MPYVDQGTRERLKGRRPCNEGELTYALQQMVKDYLPRPGDLRFSEIAGVLGAIEALKLDFINRVVTPYEVKKCRMNGDVWGEYT